MDRDVSINFNAIDELQIGITTLHCNGQRIFEDSMGLLNSVVGICGKIPPKALDTNLLSSTEALINNLSNYLCLSAGETIVSHIRNLVEKFQGIEETYAKSMSENVIYFYGERESGNLMPWAGAGCFLMNDINTPLLRRQLKKIEQKNETQQRIEQISYDFIDKNISNGTNSKINIIGMSQEDIYEIYGNDMENYLAQNCNWMIQMVHIASGVPSSVRDFLNNKIQDKMETRVATYEQASELRTQLLSIDNPEYMWDLAFITPQNSIKLIDIFDRHNVDDAEQRANFLAQIYKESGGGASMRENLFDCQDADILSNEFDQDVAIQYVLNHADYYLTEEESNLYSNRNSEEEFVKAISSSDNFYYLGNELADNGKIHRGSDLAVHIGQGVDAPFQVSDLILYRGGGCIQITAKENYYRFAYYVETEFHDEEAAQDIRDNGCYSKYITDIYYLESAEWYYFESPRKIELGDSFNEITKKVHGGPDEGREVMQEVIRRELENK
ncbi:MAG: hypothetical protein ACI4DK_04330 [Lachnospiraceae bacterium]